MPQSSLCRMVKKLKPGLTEGLTSLPWPNFRLAYCLPHHAYSTPSEGGTDGGGKAYGLEDLAGVHHGDGRSGTARAQRISGHGESPLTPPHQEAHPVE